MTEKRCHWSIVKTTRLNHIKVDDGTILKSDIIDQTTEEGEGAIPLDVMKRVTPDVIYPKKLKIVKGRETALSKSV